MRYLESLSEIKIKMQVTNELTNYLLILEKTQ